MIYSMTAFARLQHPTELGALTWELRSVNHRYLETSIRLPEVLKGAEAAARNLVAKHLHRGKVDCTLHYVPAGLAIAAQQLDEDFCRGLLQTLQDLERLADGYRLSHPSTLELLGWPGVVAARGEQQAELLQEVALSQLDAALQELKNMRGAEGEKLRGLMLERIASAEQLTATIAVAMPRVMRRQRERLLEKLALVMASLGTERLEQELVLVANKLDLDEEIDRLNVHLHEVRAILSRAEPVGRKLDFMLQEINREVNTIASKSVDSEITKAAVDLKVLAEQVREQVQNIE